jgi:hypothetical protein
VHFLPRSSPDGKPIERLGGLWREPITRRHCGTNREQLRELIFAWLGAQDPFPLKITWAAESTFPLANLD